MFNEYLAYRKFIGLLVRLKFPSSFCAKLYDIYYKLMNNKLNSIFNYTLNHMKSSLYYDSSKLRFSSSKYIWIFWWQGRNSMPGIVKKCISSIVKHSSNHKVVFLNKNNIKTYAKLPNYIYKKLNKGEITLTHFSDILRFNLLRNYGGLWVDSTIYCVSNLPNKCFNELYTASGGYIENHNNVSLGKWTSFVFGGNAHQPLFVFMDSFFKIYWKCNNHLVEYFLVDYALNYAYQHNIGGFKKYIKESVTSTPGISEMLDLINNKYNSKIYNKLVNNTPFFKLTYKMKFKTNNTFYSFIMNNR